MGDTIGDKLKIVNKDRFRSIDAAWEARAEINANTQGAVREGEVHRSSVVAAHILSKQRNAGGLQCGAAWQARCWSLCGVRHQADRLIRRLLCRSILRCP